MADIEFHHHAGSARGVDRGPQVEETVQEENLGAYEGLHTGREIERILRSGISYALSSTNLD